MNHTIKKTRSIKYSLAISVSLSVGLVISINASIPSVATGDLSAATVRELAQARAATARYHDVRNAEADGYVSIDFCEPGEGCHWANFSLIDGTFEIERPEFLLYVPGENGEVRLVAIEYVVPLSLSANAPEGFSGDSDIWREDTEGAGLWELTVWLWYPNPEGMFVQHNPRVP